MSWTESCRSGALWTGLAIIAVAYVCMSRPRRRRTAAASADFGSFLKQRPRSAAPTEFGAFLKDGGTVLGDPGVDDGEREEMEEAAPEGAVRVAVLFGTEYGFSKEIAETLGARLKGTGAYWPAVADMADFPEGYPLNSEQVVLVVCSTQGDGVPPPEARDFCDWLFGGGAGDLSGLHFSVCALGDSSYPHYCQCGKKVDAALGSGTGQRLVPRHDVDREDWTTVNSWIDNILEALPTLSLLTIAEQGGTVPNCGAKKATRARWSKNRPFHAKVLEIKGLCNVTSQGDKNTVCAILDLADSGLEYVPGDALGIYPTNSPKHVEELLSVLRADGGLSVAPPQWHYDGDVFEDEMELREVLLHCCDLRSPKPDLFSLLLDCLPPEMRHTAKVARSAGQGERAKILNGWRKDTSAAFNAHCNGTSTNGLSSAGSDCAVKEALLLKALAEDVKAREAYLEVRHVVDVLEDFPSAKPTVQQVISCLRPLQPRLYSISTSPCECPTQVGITVAEVRYATLGKARIGVASTYVSERLEVGACVPVYVSRNPDFRLPPDVSTPIIMVGPGTGIAPFRAFILQRLRAAHAEGQPQGRCVLYFGCRRRDQDFLYRDALEAWAAQGDITLHTAFSREQSHKVYVQQRLRETGESVWELLEAGAHFYVCGDANSMAGEVERALLDIVKAHSPGGGPRAYLDRLAEEGRYQRDVWF
ncbi:unnamed protein product [Ostreobium quekettii]|uniref:Uncharacterized protein n=1 Tax=Ostreobium quekettii TaxID=121088 RepID=A0A8S1IZC7_9CHLO|nr:unnamed protein product [Ostreobium quekettii]